MGSLLTSSINELLNSSKDIREIETFMINDIIDDIISTRINNADLDNSTIQSLAVALDLNKIFEYYSRAYDKSSSKINMTGHSMSNEKYSDNVSSTSHSTMTNSSNTINDIRSYYRGLSLANSTIDKFNDEIRNNLNSKDIEFLDTAFNDLWIKLNEKSTTDEISGIIHGQIQPELQRIFKLILD